MTPAEASAGLRRDAATLDQALRPSLLRAAREMRLDSIRALKAGEMGRRVFQNGEPSVTVAQSTSANDVILELRGLTALMEDGGRTKPHRIAATNARRVLTLKDGGRLGFVSTVEEALTHPGSRVEARADVEKVAERRSARIASDMEAAAAKHLGAS